MRADCSGLYADSSDASVSTIGEVPQSAGGAN
jgi:hypothetical protein